jgi:hypothetical protein
LSHQHFPKLQEKLITIRGVPLITAGVTSGHHKGGQSIILEEAQYNNIKGWIERQHPGQPTVSFQATLVPSDYAHFGQIFLNPSRTCKVKVVTNTGCESTLIGVNAVHQMGYKKSDLIQTQMRMQAIDTNSIVILGAMILRLSGMGLDSSQYTTTQVCYISPTVRGIYLSNLHVNS